VTRTGVVLMAYGSPADRSDILRYYTDIRRGRPPSEEQLAELTRRYDAIGGVSPLLERTEAQRAAVQDALDRTRPGAFDVVLGLKHSDPTIEAAVAELAGREVTRVVGAVLAPHYSGLSVGQYLSRLAEAADRYGIGSAGLQSWAVEPAFVQFLADDVERQLAAMPDSTRVIFTAHSLPARVVETGDPYPSELRATAQAVAAAIGLAESAQWETAWQSAGRTPEPWMTPDILSVIDRLGDDRSAEGLLVCACGFVADHLEVLYDLDIEARRRAETVGLRFERTRCVNDDPTVMGALAARIASL
jgi:protoporphyrin/coproporphyrin ferrochelatase